MYTIFSHPRIDESPHKLRGRAQNSFFLLLKGVKPDNTNTYVYQYTSQIYYMYSG